MKRSIEEKLSIMFIFCICGCLFTNATVSALDFEKISKPNTAKKSPRKKTITKELLFEILEKRFNAKTDWSEKYSSTQWPSNKAMIEFNADGSPDKSGKHLSIDSKNDIEDEGNMLPARVFILRAILVNSYNYVPGDEWPEYSNEIPFDSVALAVENALPRFIHDVVYYYMWIARKEEVSAKSYLDSLTKRMQSLKRNSLNESNSQSDIIPEKVAKPLFALISDYDKFMERLTNNYVTQREQTTAQEKAKEEETAAENDASKKIYLVIFIVVGGLVWHFILRRRCPNCRSTSFVEMAREIIDRFSEERSRTNDVIEDGHSHRRLYKWTVRVTIADVTFRCCDCNNVWIDKVRGEEKGPESRVH